MLTPPAAPAVVIWVFRSPSPPDVGLVRRGVNEVMKRRGWNRPDFLLAVSELVTNAVKFSDFVVVTLEGYDSQLVLTVFDDNDEFELAMPSPEEILEILSGTNLTQSENGRGLVIVIACSDEVTVRNHISVLGVPGKAVEARLMRPAA